MSFMVTLIIFSFMTFVPIARFTLTSAMEINSSAIAGCPTKCGNVEISFPFGIGDQRCFLEGFEVICNQSDAYLSNLNLRLLEILPGYVRVDSRNFIAESCSLPDERESGRATIELPEESPYTLSVAWNKFVAIGCNTVGLVTGYSTLATSCVSHGCPTEDSLVDSSCNGHCCCQASLPYDRKNLRIQVAQKKPSISFCSYGFIVENGTLE